MTGTTGETPGEGTLLEALVALGQERRKTRLTILSMVGAMPTDGTPEAGIGVGRGPTGGRPGVRRTTFDVDQEELAAFGRIVGRTDEGSLVVAYAEIVVGLAPIGRDGGTTIRAVARAGRGTEATDLASLARLAGDEWLDDGTMAERWNGRDDEVNRSLPSKAIDAFIAFPGHDLREVGIVRPRGDDPAAGGMGRKGVANCVPGRSEAGRTHLGATLRLMAGHSAPGLSWEADPGQNVRLASCWTPRNRVVVVRAPAEANASAVMGAAVVAGARRRTLEWMAGLEDCRAVAEGLRRLWGPGSTIAA